MGPHLEWRVRGEADGLVVRVYAPYSVHLALRPFDRNRYVSFYVQLTGLTRCTGVAVPVLGGWHVYLASRGETSIESHDNSYLEGKAKSEGLVRGPIEARECD